MDFRERLYRTFYLADQLHDGNILLNQLVSFSDEFVLIIIIDFFFVPDFYGHVEIYESQLNFASVVVVMVFLIIGYMDHGVLFPTHYASSFDFTKIIFILFKNLGPIIHEKLPQKSFFVKDLTFLFESPTPAGW